MRGAEVRARCGLLLPDVNKWLTGEHEIEQLLSMPARGSPQAVHLWACLQVKSCPVCGGNSCLGLTLLPGALSVIACRLWLCLREHACNSGCCT